LSKPKEKDSSLLFILGAESKESPQASGNAKKQAKSLQVQLILSQRPNSSWVIRPRDKSGLVLHRSDLEKETFK
jgi:hypothetical protein